MRFFGPGFISLLCVASGRALHESEVGIVDWHKHLIGVPLSSSTATAPVFHRVGGTSTHSVIVTATGNNVLAALNPVNGSVAWRYLFEPHDRITTFHKRGNVVAALSGPGGATLRSFDALAGHLLLEKRLHNPDLGGPSEPNHVGTFLAFIESSKPGSRPDLFALTNGYTVHHIDGSTGAVKWSWSSPSQSSLVIYSKLAPTPTAIYVIGLAKSLASYTLHVTSLSPTTGEVIATANIPSSISDGLSHFMILSPNDSTTNARVVWLEQRSIKSFVLTPTLKGRPTAVKGSAYKQIIDVGLGQHGQLVAIKTDGSSCIFKLEGDSSELETIWEYQDSGPSDRNTDSIFAGGLDKAGYPYIARVYWSRVLKKAAVEVFSSHLAEGKGLVTGFSFPFDTGVHGIISHVAIDSANPSGWTVLTRLVLTTTTGAIQLWQQDKLQWTREESLAAVSVAEFVELPERVVSSSHVGEVAETFYARVVRQLSDAQDFPQYAVNFVRRFATGSYASVSSSAASSADAGPLSRDTFGFRQIIVAATTFGKIYGIDSSNGEILWSRILGLGWTALVGGRVQPVKLFVIRTVSDGDSPQVVLVTQRRADNSSVDTVLFHIDALTGTDARNVTMKGDILQGLDIISGPVVDAYLFHNETKAVLLLDELLQVHIYPDTAENKIAFGKTIPSLHLPLRTSSPGQHRLTGHQFVLNTALSDKFVAYPTWTLSLPPEEDIQSLVPSSRGPVASIGKVLANRTTLYKYLNPRLLAMLTVSHSISPPTCAVYLVDGAKGSIIYRATLPSSAGHCDIKVSLAHNWLVYHYFDEEIDGVGQAKGYRMVAVELYEGQQIDDKTKSSDMSSFSNKSIAVTAMEQSYVFPHGITAISTTSTKFGITGKDIIVATRHHKIQSFPWRLLNPRRPNRKTTAEEQEEYLVQYDPILADDPQRVLSHNYEVANIQRILTSPALLESTSLVFAYGLDMFLTRVAPSNTFDVLNENFNKAQLVLTVSGLAVAIMVTKPMVRRKRLKERWYQ